MDGVFHASLEADFMQVEKTLVIRSPEL